MISSSRTFSWPLTFWQFLFWIFTYIISITLLFMTWLAKMCVSPTKPLSSWTTEFAFKLYEIFSMFWAILYWNLTAVRANKLLWFKWTCILLIIHRLSTIFPSTEIWIFAFKALKICINCHCILTRFIMIRRFRIFELFIFIAAFEFQSFQRHGLNFIEYFRIIFYKWR